MISETTTKIAGRPRHPNKEYEHLLRSLEAEGWRITKRHGGYFRAWCHCGSSDHIFSIPLTPSDHRAWRNVNSALKRTGHWEAVAA